MPDVTTELESDYLVRKALHRRSVAAHVAGFADFTIMEKVAETYFNKLFEGVPSGYERVSLNQLQIADERLFMMIAKETRA
eukprot:380793-Amphidinium_carterae.1